MLDNENTVSSNLVVPDVETDLSGIMPKNTESQVENNIEEERKKSEEKMFGTSGDNSNIEVSDEGIQGGNVISRPIEEQINKDLIRTVYVNTESEYKFPCAVFEFTCAKNMSISVLRQLKMMVLSDGERDELALSRDEGHNIGKVYDDGLDCYDDVIEKYSTRVYTKYGDKIVHIGYMSKNEALRLSLLLLAQSGIGELGKDYVVQYAGEDGKFIKADLTNSCDYINL